MLLFGSKYIFALYTHNIPFGMSMEKCSEPLQKTSLSGIPHVNRRDYTQTCVVSTVLHSGKAIRYIVEVDYCSYIDIEWVSQHLESPPNPQGE